MRTTQLQLSAEAAESVRLDSLMAIFSRADSVLSNRSIRCELSKVATGSPSWTDGKLISFDRNELPKTTDPNGLVVLNGLNYHELAHVLYTLPRSSDFGGKIPSKQWQVYNMLEDQRIEGLLITQYPSVAPYLVATIAHFFMQRSGQQNKAWPVISGRKYLPANMRDALRDAYVRGDGRRMDVDKLDRLITEYKRLRFFGRFNDQKRALEIIDAVWKMLSDANQENNIQNANPFAHKSQADGEGQQQQGDQDAGDTDGAEQQAAQGGGGSGEGSESDSDGSDGSGQGSDGEDGSEPGQGTADGEGKDDGNGSSKKKDGKDKGGNGAGTSGERQQSLREIMSQTLERVYGNTQVHEEVTRQHQTMKRFKGRYNGRIKVDNRQQKGAVSATSQGIAKSFGRQLQRIVEEHDPGYDTHKNAGKLNVKRAIRGDALDVLFDQWNEGNADTSSIETIILLDISGSMNTRIHEATEATWIVKRAHDMLGGAARCTVFTFNTSARKLMDGNQVSSRTTMAVPTIGGGTDPGEALIEARDIFATSQRKHKALITVSDGSWGNGHALGYVGNSQTNDQIMESLNQAGVLTASLLLDGSVAARVKNGGMEGAYMAYGHQASIFVPASSCSEITTLGRQMVTRMMKGK